MFKFKAYVNKDREHGKVTITPTLLIKPTSFIHDILNKDSGVFKSVVTNEGFFKNQQIAEVLNDIHNFNAKQKKIFKTKLTKLAIGTFNNNGKWKIDLTKSDSEKGLNKLYSYILSAYDYAVKKGDK